MITLERQAASTLQLPLGQRAQYITLNRWNYAVGWKDQPQEGLSRASSTFIEPSKEAGFSLYNAAARLVHTMTGGKALPPAAPRIGTVVRPGVDEASAISDARLLHPLWTPGVSGAPTEVCFYSKPPETDEDKSEDDRCGENTTDWVALNYNNVTNGTATHASASSSGSMVCAVTRNFEGRSPTACINTLSVAREDSDGSDQPQEQ